MYPRSVSSTPATSRPSPSVFGVRPVATSKDISSFLSETAVVEGCACDGAVQAVALQG